MESAHLHNCACKRVTWCASQPQESDVQGNAQSNFKKSDEKSDEKHVLAQTLLAQYPVALVDEFQDTDPQQFAILQGIYYQAEQRNEQPNKASSQAHSQAEKEDTALYLIGDPKQAIYGFRGGDIFAYLNVYYVLFVI